jgi:uncharacterized damage-inducible protein DinB
MNTTHPIVQQLKFTRAEFKRGLKGLSEDEAGRRLLPMNCISWNVGHLAWQEQKYIVYYGQGQMPYPEIEKHFSYGAPASTPSLHDMVKIWQNIIVFSNSWLEAVTSQKLQEFVVKPDGAKLQRSYGSLLQRMIYHYWYHTGENLAVRQMLGHTDLPQFVGNIDRQAPYMPE